MNMNIIYCLDELRDALRQHDDLLGDRHEEWYSSEHEEKLQKLNRALLACNDSLDSL